MKYEFTDYKNYEFHLHIWNPEGNFIEHCLVLNSKINGNSFTIKNLVENYRWFREEKGVYIRKNNTKLLSLGDDFAENEEGLYQSALKLLKNGFGIKL